MDNLVIDQTSFNQLYSGFQNYFTENKYLIPYDGTKYGFMTSFLTRYMELHTNPTNPHPFNAKNSTTWGLAKAYLMYLNSVDVENRRTIPDTYIQTDVLTHDEIRYLSGRGGVIVYDDLSDRTFGVRDLISFIDPEDYSNFLTWMNLYQ